MNVIKLRQNSYSQTIHQHVTSNDRGEKGENGVGIKDLKITDNNRLIATLDNDNTVDAGAIPAAKNKRLIVGDMDGLKSTYTLPNGINHHQISYILINGVSYNSDYTIDEDIITLNYDELPSGVLEVVINDSETSTDGTKINGKSGDVILKTINGEALDGRGDIELISKSDFNVKLSELNSQDRNLQESILNKEHQINQLTNSYSILSSETQSLSGSVSEIKAKITPIESELSNLHDNSVSKSTTVNNKPLDRNINITAEDTGALPITAGREHPLTSSLYVNGTVTANDADSDSELTTKRQLIQAKDDLLEELSLKPSKKDLEETNSTISDIIQCLTAKAKGKAINLVGTTDAKIRDIKLFGDTTQTQYTGKNLFNWQDPEHYLNGIIPNNNATAFTTGSTNIANQNKIITLKIPALTSTTYTISSGLRFKQILVYESADEPEVGKPFTLLLRQSGTQSVTVTTNPTTNWLFAKFYNSYLPEDYTFNELASSIQVEQGTEATVYEQYVGERISPNLNYPQTIINTAGDQTITISGDQNQSETYTIPLGDIELCKIGDYQDKIYYDNGWKLERNVTNILLDGNINYKFVRDGIYYIDKYNDYATKDNIPICERLIGINNIERADLLSNQPDETVACSNGVNANRIYIKSTKQNPNDIFRANPTKLYYGLKNPIINDITNIDLIAQLDNLRNARTYKSQTNLSATTEISVDTLLSADYVLGRVSKVEEILRRNNLS